MEDEQEFSRALVGVREEWLALREDLTLAGQREVRTIVSLVVFVVACACAGAGAAAVAGDAAVLLLL